MLNRKFLPVFILLSIGLATYHALNYETNNHHYMAYLLIFFSLLPTFESKDKEINAAYEKLRLPGYFKIIGLALIVPIWVSLEYDSTLYSVSLYSLLCGFMGIAYYHKKLW